MNKKDEAFKLDGSEHLRAEYRADEGTFIEMGLTESQYVASRLRDSRGGDFPTKQVEAGWAERDKSIAAACMLAGCPQMAATFQADPRHTTDTVIAQLVKSMGLSMDAYEAVSKDFNNQMRGTE